MFTRTFNSSLLSIATLALLTSQVFAVPTQIVDIDTPQCDVLSIPTDVHELGDVAVFPADEALFATDLGQTSTPACLASDDPTVSNAVVDIRNLSGIAWEEVWYVADPETTISNYDGEANDIGFAPLQEAFRIDNDVTDPLGVNRPLIFESMTPDGIWEIGESWQFILQDYSNLSGLAANAINSIGVGNASPNFGINDSSGSIIAVAQVIPEPSSLLLACLGLFGTYTLRRRRS